MHELFTVDALISLLTLTVLEIVLGIDNVIFVSILMARLHTRQRLNARRTWMFAGIAVRILLLLGIGWLVNSGSRELFGFSWNSNRYSFNLRNMIMLAGGMFLLYKTVKEIHDKLDGTDEIAPHEAGKLASYGSIIGQIILVDMVFSFDSIITAVGLAKIVKVMIIAVIIAMIIMFFFSEKISSFIHKYPTLKMLALAFLLMVGFSLFFEGLEPLHHSHIDKTYIYVAMAFSFGVELLNMWMRRNRKRKQPLALKKDLPKQEESNRSGDMAH